jgi:hypothetical protein
MIFDKVHLLFLIRIRIHNLKLRIRIRILQKVSDPYGSGSGFGSGSTTLQKNEDQGLHWQQGEAVAPELYSVHSDLFPARADIKVEIVPVVVLQFLHVELNPGHLIRVVVWGQEPTKLHIEVEIVPVVQ